jgi:hypothetical protein
MPRLRKEAKYDNDKDHAPQSLRTSCKYLWINMWTRLQICCAAHFEVVKAHSYIPICTLIFFALLCVAGVGTTIVLANKYGEDM